METIIKTLEFDKIRVILSEYATSHLGKQKALNLMPFLQYDEVSKQLELTDEAVKILYAHSDLPLGGIRDISSSLKKAEIDSVLSEEELLNISSLLYATGNIIRFSKNIVVEAPLFLEIVNTLDELKPLQNEINRCIEDNGKVKDNASLELKNIRKKIRNKETEVKRKLQEIIQKKRDMLSDGLVTIRNNRYVIPVKNEYKNVIKGMIHDESSSGQTVFIEVNEVVEINNEINELYIKEKKEIERILKYLTSLVNNNHNELTINMDSLTEIDFVFAKGKYAKATKSTKPKLNTDKYLSLNNARHPLIPSDEVIANNIYLGKEFNTLLITGPNTGGKTVNLKIVGLFSLMTQSGLHIPADNNSEMCIFKKIFADIGDRQSIEQNLSTFSSHIKNIINILDNVDEDSLILYDEVGSGTDPKEGAALAISILEYTYNMGALTIATTHYPELKEYGHQHDYVMNASVEFNLESLKPTYKLLIGIPGQSNALEISKQLGLNEIVVEYANGYLDLHKDDSKDLMEKLESELSVQRKKNEELERLLHENKEKEKELQHELELLEIRKVNYLENAKLEANKLIREAQDNIDKYLKEMKSAKKEHELLKQKQDLEQIKFEEKQQVITNTENIELQVGDEVIVLPFEQRGTLVKKIGNNDWEVKMGPLTSKVKKKNILFYKRQKKADKVVKSSVKKVLKKHVSNTLDLRGMRVAEAMRHLDKYLDDILLVHYPSVTIIHGHGTGAVRKAVRERLEKNSKFTKFRYGGEGEGGLGVTIIEM